MNPDQPGWTGHSSDFQAGSSPGDPSKGSASSPWSIPDAAMGGSPPRTPGSNRGLWLILGGIFGVLLLMCGGLVAVGIFSFRELAKSDSPITLPAIEETSNRDRDTFAELMQDEEWPAHPQQQQLETWLQAAIDQSRTQGLSVGREMFYEAILKSPQGASINSVARLQLKETLKLGTPQPDVLQHYNLLGIRQGSAPGTAELYILFYGDSSMAEMTVWFIDQDRGTWHLYDYGETDMGRRISDEYANYFLHIFHDDVDGYDNAIELINQADQHRAEGNDEQAAVLLREAERARMLPADRDRALLQIGWAYQRQNDWKESQRVFEKIRRKDEVAGVWASSGINQIQLTEYDAAIASADRLRQLFGRHPAADFVTARALEAKGDQTAATEHLIRCLQLCPNDATAFRSAISMAAEDQLEKILDLVLKSDTADEWYLSVLDWHTTLEAHQTIQTVLAKHDDAPAVWSAYLKAVEETGQEDGAAPSLFHEVATDSAVSEPIRESARFEWLQLRLSGNNPEKLAEEAANRRELVQEILDGIMYDEWYAEGDAVLTFLKQLPPDDRDQPAAHALAGWGEYQQANWSAALDAFERALAANEDASPFDDEAVRENVEWYAFESLMELENYSEAFARFGDRPDLAIRLGQRVVLPGHQDAQTLLLEQLETRDEPTARALESFLRAHQATAVGDTEACEAHWRECLLAATSFIDDAENYLLDQLASDYGRHLVRQSHVPALVRETAHPFWESAVRGACNEAANLHDRALARELEKQVTVAGESEAEEAVIEMLARLAYADHRWDDAARFYKQQYQAASEDDWSYLMYSSREKLFDAYLRSEQFDQARELLQETESSENAAMRATLLAATGEFTEIESQLADELPVDVGYWFFQPSMRRWLLQDPAAVSEMINDWNIQLGQLQTPWSAILLQSDETALDAQGLRERLLPILGEELEVVRFSPRQSPLDQQQWLVRRGEDLLMVISAGPTKWDGFRFGARQRQEFRDKQQSSVGIEVIHSRRPLPETMVGILSALADEATFAIAEQNRNYLWLQNDQPWDQRMVWAGRLPVDTQTIPDTFLFVASEVSETTEADSETVEASTRSLNGAEPVEKERLQQLATATSADPRDDHALPARVRLSVGLASEWLIVRVVAYDETEDRATVRLQEPSSLFPPFREETQLLVSAYEVMKPTPGKTGD